MTTFVGNICKAAATRYVESLKTTVTDFSVAENYQARNGQRYTEFYRISIWDKRGANLEKYLTLGRPVQITGRVKAGKPYQNKEGKWVSGLEIANPQITFVTANPTEVDAAAAPEAPELPVDEVADNDKPF